MNEEKLVIFDWGGVIESHREGEYSIFTATIHFIHRFRPTISSLEILERWNQCERDEEGKSIAVIGSEDGIKKWMQRICDVFSIQEDYEFLRRVYEEEFAKIYYYQEVVQFIQSLKGSCKIAILSNLSFLDKERLDQQVSLKNFDFVFLSFELGYAKPNPKIYEIVEKTSKIAPHNILFIDDYLKNLIPAKQRGWSTCQASGYQLDKIEEAITSFLK